MSIADRDYNTDFTMKMEAIRKLPEGFRFLYRENAPDMDGTIVTSIVISWWDRVTKEIRHANFTMNGDYMGDKCVSE